MTALDGVKRIENMGDEEARVLLTALREEILTRCTADGLFWLQFVYTRDEADPEHTVKPFPVEKEYIQVLWKILVEKQRVAVAKSRQMIVSWLLCAFCAWWARFHPNQYIIWQTQKKEDADKMVALAGGDKDLGYLGRMQFIEHNLPPWMRLKIRESEGKLSYPNGSLIEAVAGGADQVRGKVASVIVEDEYAYQADAKGVYQAVAPLIQKATKFVCVSTPNGMSNTFAHIYHGTQEARS